MNQGVEILLARMDSNPDEFVGTSWPSKNKWAWVVDDLRRRMAPTKEDKEFGQPLRFLSDEEVRMLWEKLESLRADQFTKAVMRTLLEEEDEHAVENPFADAVVRGMGKLAQYGTKPNKIVVGRSQYEALKKEYAGVFPSIEDAAYQQIVDDLNALEASKKRRKK